MNGLVIGSYQIIGLIGGGGIASVYEARHTILGSTVAVKVLNPILSVNDKIRNRFFQEAQLMASMNHPNITRVIDIVDCDGHLAIVMEILIGEDLNQRVLGSGALSDDDASRILSQLLNAMQYAHQMGIVHRDIKPSNIFLTQDNQIKILDFGIAKLFGQGNELTQTGTQMGTPVYMSPEQVIGDKSIDHRSDIYSLGVTLYFLISGEIPYKSISQFDVYNKIVHEPLPKLSKHSIFSAFISKACEKDRELRYQNCDEWIGHLRSSLIEGTDKNEALPVVGSDTNHKPSNPRMLRIAVFFLFLVIVIVCLDLYIVVREKEKEIVALKTVIEIPSVEIGDQIWMAKNLDVDTFSNGDLIPEARTMDEWLMAAENKSAAWCNFGNDTENGMKYGKLYNWYAVIDRRGLAPQGWRIPSELDWEILISYVGDSAGLKLQNSKDFTGNLFGFNALMAGSRYRSGNFDWEGIPSLEIFSNFWTINGQRVGMMRNEEWINLDRVIKISEESKRITDLDEKEELGEILHPANGFSVRCLK
jgi:uncharacterized protein (TIGR02145 family)